MFQRLKSSISAYSKHPKAMYFLSFFSFIEAAISPFPPDLILLPMMLTKPKDKFLLAGLCMISSVVGGFIGYFIGLTLWEHVSPFFFHYLISKELFLKIAELYRENTFLTIISGGLSLIPYKIFTISGGAVQVSFFEFAAASICSRSIRFFSQAMVIHFFGASGVRLFKKHILKVALVIFVCMVLYFIRRSYS